MIRLENNIELQYQLHHFVITPRLHASLWNYDNVYDNVSKKHNKKEINRKSLLLIFFPFFFSSFSFYVLTQNWEYNF